jgi:hypothetical protein
MTTLLAEATRPATGSGAALCALDRCDRCNAQAYVRVTLPFGELFFCGHHARAHASAYEHVAVAIHDESDKLMAQFGSR